MPADSCRVEFDRPPEPDMHRVARWGDTTSLSRLVADGFDINQKAHFAIDHGMYLCDLTPLMIAAASFDGATVETVRWLVEHGANLELISEGGCTAAWYAAGGMCEYFGSNDEPTDHDERLRFLLDAGLDPSECGHNGRSLLCEACQSGDPRRVKLLIERGANAQPVGLSADQTNYSFVFPIFCAVESDSAECVRLVLAAGADPNSRDSMNQTPLMLAGSEAVAQALIDAGADLQTVNEFGDDVLQVILKEASECTDRGGMLDVARLLIQSGIDIEKNDEYGHTRLYSMAFSQAAAAVEFLLQQGADPFAVQGESGTALHGICWQGEYEDTETMQNTVRIIELLVAAGIEVNTSDPAGNTPLMAAVGGDWGCVTAVSKLIELGADVNGANDYGVTALMFAAMNSEKNCILELLKHGSDVHAQDGDGQTALDYAVEHCETWQQINQEPPDIDLGIGEDPTDVAARHADQLKTAQECVAILEEAMNA